MIMTSRRGFSLVELLIALTVAASVGAVIGRVLLSAHRLSRWQVEQSNLQDNVRAGALILPAELRELGFDSTQSASATGNFNDVMPDILEMTAHQIRIRAMRGFGLVCASAPHSTSDVTIRLPWRGFRIPTLDDAYLLFVERQTDQATDDEWYPLNVTSIDPVSCGGQPALHLRFGDIAGAGFTADDVVSGGPIRAYEIMDYGLYNDGTHSWLGARSVSHGEAAYQPVLGPLDPATGVTFEYLDKNGNPIAPSGMVAERQAVRAIQLTIRGLSSQPVTMGFAGMPRVAQFTLTTRVALRNNLRS